MFGQVDGFVITVGVSEKVVHTVDTVLTQGIFGKKFSNFLDVFLVTEHYNILTTSMTYGDRIGFID